MFKSIKMRLLLRDFLIIFCILVIFNIIFSITIYKYYMGYARNVLSSQIKVACNFYGKYLANTDILISSEEIISNYSYLPFRIQIIDKEFQTVADNLEPDLRQKVETQDVKEALQGSLGINSYIDENSKENTVSYSAPLKSGDNINGVLRFSTVIEDTQKAINALIIISLTVSLMVIAIVILLSLFFSGTITKPIFHLKDVSHKIANGDFSVRAEVYYNDETGALAESINEMSNELKNAEKLKGEFIASVTHELRTPLTIIKGWALTLLKLPPDECEENQKGLEIIAKQTHRLEGMIEELLDFSTLHACRMKIIKNKTNVRELITDLIEQLQPRAMQYKVVLYCSFQETDIFVHLDLSRIRQVLLNLIENSFKNTVHGNKIEVTVKVLDDENGKSLYVEVSDNGRGISREELPNIKQKFYKGKKNQFTNGLGLGLSICDQIVEMHGGKMDISSIEGKGTKVWFQIPI